MFGTSVFPQDSKVFFRNVISRIIDGRIEDRSGVSANRIHVHITTWLIAFLEDLFHQIALISFWKNFDRICLVGQLLEI